MKRLVIHWSFKPWWYCFFPFPVDEETGKRVFLPMKFGFELLKGKPCPTRWLYDWILDLGWLHIYYKAA
jgi:hypothetical protein